MGHGRHQSRNFQSAAGVLYWAQMRVTCKILLALLLASCAVAPLPAKKMKSAIPMTKRPNQLAEIKDAALISPQAAQPCQNFAWAAVLEKLLAAQQVPMPQRALVAKSSNGERCLDTPVSLPAISSVVSGDYVLDSGRKIRITVTYLEGTPAYIDPLLAALQSNQPLLLLYNGKPMLLYGVLYDEYVARNGSRIYQPRELHLADPAAPAARQHIVFTVGKDDANQINGLLSVDVKDRVF